jgi:1,4-alpha-glucan branching enzyme
MDAIVSASHADPFAVLGAHQAADGSWVVRTFQPGARAVQVIDRDSGDVHGDLLEVHPAGLFAGLISPITGGGTPAYRLRVTDPEPVVHHEPESAHVPSDAAHAALSPSAPPSRDVDDPYRFGTMLGDLDLHLLGEGRHWRSFDALGAHMVTVDGCDGVRFGVWAPNARRVSVVGDFNHWDGRRHVMRLHPANGLWELFVPGLSEGAVYKFELLDAHGNRLPLKADPFGFSAELRPATASKVARLDVHEWADGEWMGERGERNRRDAPMSIYEVHLGSWRRKPEQHDRWLTYAELADELVPYVVHMGFTHVELMPVSEHPFDGSWGYQPIGLFAPTSRHGSPTDFQLFVDRCHQAGIGVILDWVPAHFPSDAHGLAEFDGTHLYEHADPRLGFHPDWNTLIYNFGRREVVNFLISNALFWLEQYHVDGLRVDAVASMLYLDYSRKAGEWLPNRNGGNHNLEAVDFLRLANVEAYGQHPDTMTIAEESTAWPGVSKATDAGGLGFGFKWNMGWMNDTLRYFGQDPVYRKYHQGELSFGLVYAFDENFVLPISHDEVVHGKGTLLTRMPGNEWEQFANVRALFGFMFTHPGKKLMFMGCEYAQRGEWSEARSLDWHLTHEPLHGGVQRLVHDLNRLYRSMPALHERDNEPSGFEWISHQNAEQSVYAYLRRGAAGDAAAAVVVCNFTPVVHRSYRIGVPAPGFYAERLNTDAEVYGGGNHGNLGGVQSEPVPWNHQPHSIAVTLPPLGVAVFEVPVPAAAGVGDDAVGAIGGALPADGTGALSAGSPLSPDHPPVSVPPEMAA